MIETSSPEIYKLTDSACLKLSRLLSKRIPSRKIILSYIATVAMIPKIGQKRSGKFGGNY